MKHRCSLTVIAILIVFLLSSASDLSAGRGLIAVPLPPADSVTIDSLKLTPADMPEGYSLLNTNISKSIQASLLYENPQTYVSLIGAVQAKSVQSVKGPGGDNGAVMYFQFAGPIRNPVFIRALIWGEDSGPTSSHPEEILIEDNLLVILSFSSESKICPELKRMMVTRMRP